MAGPGQLWQAIQHTGDSIVIVDHAGVVRFVNPAAEVLFGRSRAQLLGRPFGFPLIAGDAGEIDVLRPSGGPALAQMRIAETDWQGRRAHLVYLADVTAQRSTEEELARERRYIQQLIELAPALICCVSVDGRARYVNPAFARQSGYSTEELQGLDFWQVLFRPADAGFVAGFLEQLAGNTMVQRELVLYPREGVPQTVSWTWLHRQAGGAEELVGFGTNISEQKKIEQLKDDFISSLSHELRSPLTSLLGALRLVQGGVGGEVPERAAGLVEIALRSTQRLVRLSEDILDLRKIELGQMEFFPRLLDVPVLVEQAVESTRGYGAATRVDITMEVQGADMRVLADGDRLQQVVINLLVNAVKFSPPEARVRVVVGRVGGMVRIAVSDSGPGIPMELRPHIFDRFVRARVSPTRSKVGSGLGLSIAKSIVDRLGGEIGFQTELNQGTTFFVELPEGATEAAPRSLE